MEKKLSKKIVDYSLKLKENDRVLITYESDKCNNLIKYLIKDITEKNGIVFVNKIDSEINALLLETTRKNRIEEIKKRNQFDVDNYDCFVNIRYNVNEYDDKNINAQIIKEIGEATKESRNIRVNDRRWVLLNYPSMLDAYKAKMTYDEFYNYAFKSMIFDYEKMANAVEPLKKLMENTDKVRLTGKNTDITFSIKDMDVIPCLGTMNIPDGEIFTAPIKDSINGKITYNTPSPYRGNVFHHVSLTFENGKIINATCDEDDKVLSEILNTDEGARFIGEFSIGLNPYIREPMEDILFDEKIIGSIHFTPGAAYKEAYNGNDSSIHWDMVLIQREEYGGGEIYFDDKLIRKNGKFILDELKDLNFE